MHTRRLLSSINSIIKVRIFKKRIPLVVSWEITKKCNQKCQYCNLWKVGSKVNTEELDTKQIFAIIDNLSEMGTQRVSLTGGEPLLREDIGQIINCIFEKNISVQLNTNGSLIRDKIDEISNVNLLNFSFDGKEKIHDFVRGDGTHKKVMEAIEIAHRKHMNIMFLVTLSKYNLDLNNIEYILDIAEKFKAGVAFQPSTLSLWGGEEKNLAASPEKKYKQLIEKLIGMKAAGNKCIFNSLSGLRYIYNWPKPTLITCAAGRLYCRIAANGDVNICNSYLPASEAPNCRTHSFQEAFKMLFPSCCDSCWCARMVELNCALMFNTDPIFNLFKWELRR